MKRTKTLQKIAEQVRNDNPNLDDVEDGISLCEYVSRTQGVELTLEEADGVQKHLAGKPLESYEVKRIRGGVYDGLYEITHKGSRIEAGGPFVTRKTATKHMHAEINARRGK